jgi:hypothetical protein
MGRSKKRLFLTPRRKTDRQTDRAVYGFSEMMDSKMDLNWLRGMQRYLGCPDGGGIAF